MPYSVGCEAWVLIHLPVNPSVVLFQWEMQMDYLANQREKVNQREEVTWSVMHFESEKQNKANNTKLRRQQ